MASHFSSRILDRTQIFLRKFKSTCQGQGISGAVGKVGAIIGSFGFLWVSHDKKEDKKEKGYPEVIGMNASLIILAVVCLLGMVVLIFYV